MASGTSLSSQIGVSELAPVNGAIQAAVPQVTNLTLLENQALVRNQLQLVQQLKQ